MAETARLTAIVETKGTPKATDELVKLSKGANRAEVSAKKLKRTFAETAKGVRDSVNVIEGPFSGISSRISAFSSLLITANPLTVSFGIALAGVGFAAAAALREASKFTVLLGQQTALLNATSNAAGMTAIQLESMASRVALATLDSVEGITEAQNVLLTFDRIMGDTFTRAIELSADLASLPFFGTSAAAATALGKALQDPIKGMNSLNRSGVTFNKTQRDNIKNLQDQGDLLGAQAILLDGIASQVSGASTAAVSGLAGATDTLGQKWQEFNRQLDKTFGLESKATEVIGSIAELISRVTNSLKDNQEAINVLNFDKLFEVRERLKALNSKEKVTFIELLEKKDLEAEETQLVESLKRGTDLVKKETKVRAEESAKALKASLDNQARIQKQADDAKILREKEVSEKLEKIKQGRQAQKDKAFSKKVRNDLFDIEIKAIQAANAKKDQIAETIKEKERTDAEELFNIKFAESEKERTLSNDMVKAQQKSFDEIDRIRSQDLVSQKELNGGKIRDDEIAQSKKISSLQTGLSNISSLMSTQSQELFRIGQAAALANAIVNTSLAISNALKADLPFPLPEILAGTAAIAGGVQVAAIASAKPPAREQGGQFAAGQDILVGERGPEIRKFDRPGTIINAQDTKKALNGGDNKIQFVLIDQSSGGTKDVVEQENKDGRIVVLIRDIVSGDSRNTNSDIHKSFKDSFSLQGAF